MVLHLQKVHTADHSMKLSHYASATVVRVVALILNAIGMLFLFPIILNNIGEHDFGIWSIASSITSYLLLIDFGVSIACTRFLSLSIGNDKQWQKIVTNGVTLSLILMIFLLVIGISILILRHYQINLFSDQTLSLVIGILVIEAGVSMLLRVYASVLRAELKYVQLGVFEIFRVILRIIGFPLILFFGGGLIELIIYSAFVNIAFFLTSYLYVKLIQKKVYFNKSYIDFSFIKELFNFGKYAVIVIVAEFFRYRLDGIFIGIVMGLASVAQYAIIITVVDMCFQVLFRFLSYWETIIIRHTETNKELAIDYMFKSMKIGFWLSAFFIGNIYLFGEMFLTLWVGQKYAHLADELTILSCLLTVLTLQISITPYLAGNGKQKADAFMALTEVISKAAIAILAIQHFGFKGIMLATIIIGLTVSLFGRFFMVAKISNLSYLSLIKRLLRTIMPIVLILASSYLLLMILNTTTLTALSSKVIIVLLEITLVMIVSRHSLSKAITLIYTKNKQRK